MKCEPLSQGEIVASHTLVEEKVGNILGTCPGGIVGPEGSVTPYVVKPPNVGTKRALGALRARKDLQDKHGRHVAEWVATALGSLGGEDLGDPRTAGALKVCKLTVGDVLYLTLAVKLFSPEDGLPLPTQSCSNCGHEIKGARAPASGLEVLRWPRTKEEGGPVSQSNPPMVRVGLRYGVELAPGRVAKTLLLRSPTWGEVMWALPPASWSNPVDIAIATVRGACCGCELDDVPLNSGARLTMAQIESMHEADLELAEEAVSRLAPRAQYVAEVDCPECGVPNIFGVDWKDAVFF